VHGCDVAARQAARSKFLKQARSGAQKQLKPHEKATLRMQLQKKQAEVARPVGGKRKKKGKKK